MFVNTAWNRASADVSSRQFRVGSTRAFPDTRRGIHVFSDQLAPWMSDGQWRFAATHYAGAQKMTRNDADRLRAINPSFLILHYRLGLGLGYRAIQGGCQPTGEWLGVIEGNDWVREYPDVVQENWFYHYPESTTNRVLNCDWGWYLMNLDDPAWRQYWQGEVLRQLQANDDDGVFMDSLSVPNYMGYDRYQPNLPALNEAFETAWSSRITGWLLWLQTQPVGAYHVIPNVGSWINSRDRTDYSPADGVMIEGFAIAGDQSPYPLSDWELQMNRALALVSQGKVIIAQSYATGDRERMFTVGSYLLVKGDRAFVNIEVGFEPEWYPEYDIPVGAPTQTAGTDITSLYSSTSRVYRRNFDNGFVLVNPRESGTAITVNLGGTYYLAKTSGGGILPASGAPTGTVTYEGVTHVTLPPYSTAVLLNAVPQSTTTFIPTTIATTSVTSQASTSLSYSFSVSSPSTHAEEAEPIPGFQAEVVLLGVIVGMLVLSLNRSQKTRKREG